MSRLRASRSILFFLFLLAGATLLAIPAAAGTNFWTALGPEGASVTALAVHPVDQDIVFAATQRAGVYKSSDGGASWNFASHGIGSASIFAFALDPSNSGTAYAAGESGAVFKAIDGGGVWTRVWAGAPSNGVVVPTFSLAIDARRPSTLFAGTREGLFRSTDAGATWSARGLDSGGAVRSLAYDAAGGWLYAGVDGQGVFRSFNQGKTWERIGNGLPPNVFYLSLAIDPDRPRTLLVTTPQGLYRSLDRGSRWQKVGGVPDVNATSVAFQRGGRVYATFTSGIFYSADSGATWRRSANLADRNGELRALAAGSNRAYVGVLGDFDGPGLYRSLDGGATWQPAVTRLQGLAVTSVAVDPSDSQTIYAAVGFGRLLKTTDGGAHWTRIRSGLLGGFYLINDILIDPAQPETVWVAGAVDPPVLRSDDGGATWVAMGEPGLLPEGIAIDPRAPGALWLAGWRGVYHSADGGHTWEHRGPDAPNLYLSTVQVDPRNPDIVYAAGREIAGDRPVRFQSVVLRSADGGLTWERRDAGLDGGVVDFAVDTEDPSTLYAVTGRPFRSTDAGVTWTPLFQLSGFVYLTVAAAPAGPHGPAAIYTARQLPTPAVFRSTDRGQTWTPLRAALALAVPRVLEVDPSDPAQILLGTENRSLLSYTVGGAQ